jgi:GMP synthase (glutamine-hydrolysing)
MAHDTIVVLDYGAQYSQLIVRRVREENVFCRLFSWRSDPAEIMKLDPKASFSVVGRIASMMMGRRRCRGLSWRAAGRSWASVMVCSSSPINWGGRVARSQRREYGPASLQVGEADSPLFSGWQAAGQDESNLAWQQVWMSHGDKVEVLPSGFQTLAVTDNSPHAAAADPARDYYAVQFHPEVAHTRQGRLVLRNFVQRICGCRPDWTPANFIAEQVHRLRQQIGSGRVVVGLSGGVDSAVAAALIHRAVGDQLTCVFVDHGLLRQGEPAQVVHTFRQEQGHEACGRQRG